MFPFNSLSRIFYEWLSLTQGSSLKAKSTRGAMVLGLGTMTGRGLRFLRNMILARILAPEEFGLMAIVMVVATVFEAISEVGVRESIIQNKRGADDEYLNIAWWAQALRGMSLFLIGIVSAPLMSSFYDRPELLDLLRVAFIAILFRGFVSPRFSVLWKKYKYGRVVLLSQGSGIIGTFIAIGLAFVIRNVWALVIGFVAEAAVLCLLSYVFVPFLPRFKIHRERFSELMKFVSGMAGAPIMGAISLQMDIAFLGKMVAKEWLGKYSLAVQLAYLPIVLFGYIIRPVLLPAFAQKQDDRGSLCRAILQISRVTAILTIPLIMFMATCAGGILLLAYGSEYVAVAVPLSILSICIIVRTQSMLFTQTVLALGQPNLHRCFTALRLVIVLCLMYPAILMFDLSGAAAVILLANLVILCIQVIVVGGLIGLRIPEYIRSWLPGLLLSGVVLITISVLQILSIHHVIGNVVVVGLSCIVSWMIGLIYLKPNGQRISSPQECSEKPKYLSSS